MHHSGWGILPHAAAGAFLGVFGAWAFAMEAPPFFAEGWGEPTIVDAVLTRSSSPALSNSSAFAFLFNCRVAMTSITGRAQPTAVRHEIASRCRSEADNIVLSTPFFAAAWQVGALGSYIMGDWAGLNHRLRYAYAHAPYQNWQAELRIDLVEAAAEHVAAEIWPLHLSDLKLLLQYDSGRRFLVPRYLALQPLQERINVLLDELAESDRLRFVALAGRAEKERRRSHGH
jgi:hypothetical protein